MYIPFIFMIIRTVGTKNNKRVDAKRGQCSEISYITEF